MAVPEFSAFFLPILTFAAHNSPCPLSEMKKHCAELFKLSPQDLSEKLNSGRVNRFDNRVQWAKTYLVKAGLLEATQRGIATITDSGRNFLSKKPKSIAVSDLEQFPTFRQFHRHNIIKSVRPLSGTPALTQPLFQPPNEQIEEIVDQVNQTLADELLKEIVKTGPKAFEQLVLDVIRKMGYGIDGKTTQYVKDGGIDGVVKEDRLGLSEIYLQAKLWESNVGSRDIQQFIGAIATKKAQKGIFITNSDFTKEAISNAAHSPLKIVLINGKDLVSYMIQCGVGTQTYQTYELKRIDRDYFESIS